MRSRHVRAGGFVARRLVVLAFLLAACYLSLYTWNQRTGVLDSLAENTGLELTVWLLRPAAWGAEQGQRLWHRYVDLRAVETLNHQLRAQLERQALELAELREAAARGRRLEALLGFNPPQGWLRQGARVVSQQFGPAGALKTFIIDKGQAGDVDEQATVMVPAGLVGRVVRASPSGSMVLLLADPNSRIPVVSQETRTVGILVGQGPDEPLALNFVPTDAALREGELLVTSGLAGILPPGIPVARVVSVARSDFTLFKVVQAQPLVDPRRLEEVLVLTRLPDSVEVPAPPQPARAVPQSAKPRSAARVADPAPAAVVPGPPGGNGR